uniref:Hydrogen voltage-gated channel 1 n=1 Tax=Trichuris muris TaxID=70415 RepID=A0A5S6QFV3_TRIMR
MLKHEWPRTKRQSVLAEGDTSSSAATDSDVNGFVPKRFSTARNIRSTVVLALLCIKFQVVIVALVIFDCICIFSEVLIQLKLLSFGEAGRVAACVLHYISIAVLSGFMLEMAVKLAVMGRLLLREHRMDLFDLFVIAVTFGFSVAFGGCGQGSDGVGLLIILRLWRISLIMNNIVASVKMDAEKKIFKEGRNKLALQREVCKLREYCLQQECELRIYQLILQQNGIALPTVLRMPRAPNKVCVTVEVNNRGDTF